MALISKNVKKVDNESLATKVALRRWLLGRLGITEAYVLDTCSGLGKIWDAMAEHVEVRQWTRCDKKPRRDGTLQIEAAEALRRLPLDAFNVVDIDTYGEPWEPYLVLLSRLSRPTAVFLTEGVLGVNTRVSLPLTRAVGLPDTWNQLVPHSATLSAYLGSRVLARTHEHARILHARSVLLRNGAGAGRVTYYALGLAPLA